jgi:hypothetical protein
MNDVRPILKNTGTLINAALHPDEPSDQERIAEARRQLAAMSALELVDIIIEIRMKSPGGGFPELWA